MLTDFDASLVNRWLQRHKVNQGFRNHHWKFPDNMTDEIALRFHLLKVETSGARESFLGLLKTQGNAAGRDAVDLFSTVLVEPLYFDLCDLAGSASAIPSPNVPALPERIVPAENEIRIFLSHKSEDKALVKHYEKALTELGFFPWLDESEIRTGDEVDRKIKQAMRESCAAVFFVTENFKDETYLSDEINYAKQQHRKREKRFKIITLRFSTVR